MSVSQKSEVNRVKLYCASLSYLGSDASPNDDAPDEYGCADSVSLIIINTFGPIIKHTLATGDLYKQLASSKDFKQVVDFRLGDVLISPTGYAKTPGTVKVGHTGIMGEDEEIMSNSSGTGLFTQNYTIKTWIERYRKQGNFPLYFFRKI